MSSTSSCGCGCSPCTCNTPATFGCLPDLCVPRPCFFNGQLISADDLNAMVAYFRAKEAMLARFVGGWGILGGLRVSPGVGVRARPLTTQTLSPNPQIFAGTLAQIHPGVGIDANGRTLTLCAPRAVDLQDLAPPAVALTHPCNTWFAPLSSPLCDQEDDTGLTAIPYWIVAQLVERPSRQVPQYTGGGPCDPAPTCNFSRTIEDVEIRLVPRLPLSYFLTGCLDEGRSPLLENLERLLVQLSSSSGTSTNSSSSGNGDINVTTGQVQQPTLTAENPVSVFLPTSGLIDTCVHERYALIDAIGAALAEGCCCTTPALVLGRVLFTQNPGVLLGDALPRAPMYTVLLDAYPYRRVIAPAALEMLMLARAACGQGGPVGPQGPQGIQGPQGQQGIQGATGAAGTSGPGTVVAAGIVGAGGIYAPNAPYPTYPSAPPPTVVVMSQSAGTPATGLIQVQCAEYTTNPASAQYNYIVKVLVQETYPPLATSFPSYTVAMDSFQPSGIQLRVSSEGSLVAATTLEGLFFAIEVTQYTSSSAPAP